MRRLPTGGVLFVVCAAPLAWLAWGVIANSLGPDPVQVVMQGTGVWALRFLLLTLCITPLRRWFGRPAIIRHRRQLGLWMFSYATLHLALFAQAYVGWSAPLLWEELAERPYITVGFAAWALLLPLALTSSRGAQRKLRRRWLQLHRLIYPALVFACLHLWWQVRSDAGEALFYSAVALLLLGLRLYWRINERKRARSA